LIVGVLDLPFLQDGFHLLVEIYIAGVQKIRDCNGFLWIKENCRSIIGLSNLKNG